MTNLKNTRSRRHHRRGERSGGVTPREGGEGLPAADRGPRWWPLLAGARGRATAGPSVRITPSGPSRLARLPLDAPSAVADDPRLPALEAAPPSAPAVRTRCSARAVLLGRLLAEGGES